MSSKERTKAVAYLRTSSAANVGADKDSDKRQLSAIERFARSAGFELVGTYYDAAVSGADAVQARPGFVEMLKRIEGNGVRTIIVETAGRFARDLMVQEVGFAMLQERGIDLIAADSPGSFLDDTPTAKLVRQVLGAIAEFDKAMTVAKLRGARERRRKEVGKCEGRKSYAERAPAAVALAKKLHRYPVNGRRRSLRQVSAELAGEGFLASSGKPYGAAAVARMVG
jgi:DNA invertase Pin-like site-specific DNA recombinase